MNSILYSNFWLWLMIDADTKRAGMSHEAEFRIIKFNFLTKIMTVYYTCSIIKIYQIMQLTLIMDLSPKKKKLIMDPRKYPKRTKDACLYGQWLED